MLFGSINRVLRIAFLLGLTSASVAGIAACTSSTAPQEPADQAHCNSIVYLPPIVTIVDSASAQTICNATFTFATAQGTAAPSDLRAIECKGANLGGCPLAPTDGAPEPCAYALFGLAEGSVYTVSASAPGFASSVVTNIVAGQDGCVGPATDASRVTVPLVASK